MQIMTGRVSPAVETIIRSSSVRRWHIVSTLREQRLSEHLCTVGLLAAEIAQRLGRDPLEHLRWGVMHDLPEVYIGDTPTPGKVYANRELEDQVQDMLGIAPPSGRVRWLVKLCDLAEAYRFIRMNQVDMVGDWAAHSTGAALAAALTSFAENDPFALDATCEVLYEFIYETRVPDVVAPFAALARALDGVEDRDRKDPPGDSGPVHPEPGHYAGLDRT